jgi:hypothetical protein
MVWSESESKLWTEGDPKVISGAARKVNLVADFGPHTEMAPIAFEPDAGIHRKAGISGINIAEGLRDALIAAGEVYEAHLTGGEDVCASRTEVKLGSEKAVERAGACGHEAGCDAIVEKGSLIALEVITYFSLDARPRIYVEAQSATRANKIDGTNRVGVKTVILCEGADFHTVFGLRQSRSRRNYQQGKNSEHC